MSDDVSGVNADPGVPVPDERFVAVVRAALHDSPPVDLLDRTRALFQFSRIDAELAELLAEESSDVELAGVRGDAGTTFTFVTEQVTLEIEVHGTELNGQVLPGAPATIELRSASGDSRMLETSVVGTFEAGDLTSGSWQLVVAPHGATPLVTPWFTL